MSIEKEEINLLVDKLRNKYQEYADKYSPKWFNIDDFEERLQLTLKNKMNLEGFILAEISNFEKIKKKYEKKKEEKSFSDRVDNIIEENIARIKKYPEIDFHSKAWIEIKHFYGALFEFVNFYFSILWILVDDNNIKNSLNDFEEKLIFFAVPKGKLQPRRIEDHAMLLSRRDIKDIDIERDKNNYLKEAAFILHDIIDFCIGLIEMKNEAWNYPVRMDKLFVEEKKKKRIIEIFSGLTGYGAIMKVQEYVSGIIQDFRLGAFQKS